MQKWNLIIDVAECTNCNLCTLAAMDEYVGNAWLGYSAPMPKHGHKWINILQKERGQVSMIDIAYVPTMCNHCDDPPCVKADKTGAIKIADEEMARIVREEGLEVMRPELGTRPRIYYRNLWRYSKCFIGGTLSAEANGIVDCVEGASVRLSKNGRMLAETLSDNYGDFKFDKLDENSGRYTVEISAPGRPKRTVEANLGASINLGEIKIG